MNWNPDDSHNIRCMKTQIIESDLKTRIEDGEDVQTAISSVKKRYKLPNGHKICVKLNLLNSVKLIIYYNK